MKLLPVGCCIIMVLWFGKTGAQPIDRYGLVSRHNVQLSQVDALAPLSVGNGDFAYTADVTGMQSFGDYYFANGIPLETLSTWCWHTFPNSNGYRLQDATKEIDFHGRKILYASQEKTAAGEYFRQNPHPSPLGQIGLVKGNGQSLDLPAIGGIHQQLDLWRGWIESDFSYGGSPVSVTTVAHPDKNIVAFSIRSPLLRSGGLKPAFHFAYAYNLAIKNKPPFDWSNPDKHRTLIVEQTPNSVLLKRTIDTTVYFVSIRWQGSARWTQDSTHRFLLDATGSDSIQLVCEFSPGKPTGARTPFGSVAQQSADGWKTFWMKGGAVDFSGSTDARAAELERRIILSQYLLKINYGGSFPPQETGLTHISWYGKHNSEVYWWHTAQFYQWNHTELLEKSFGWYKKILPVAMLQARQEGFEGARWPKMAGIDGRPSPGSINPFIIWNQCNPIYLAELIYRANPSKATLEKYRDVVAESAKFLASYAFWDRATNRYILGPPIKSVAEHNDENETQNPTFELTQWYYGLKVAQDWRNRLGLKPDAHWNDIMEKLARPAVQDGKYLELETEPGMYNSTGGFASDMIMALGYLPKTPMIDSTIMAHTFDAVYQRNGLKSFTSWSLGKGALTAARLGKRKEATDILCNDIMGARFLKNGHVQRAKEPLTCPAYLPANAAFMAAAALMAGGWDGAPGSAAPGFPQDGSWHIRVENLNRLP